LILTHPSAGQYLFRALESCQVEFSVGTHFLLSFPVLQLLLFPLQTTSALPAYLVAPIAASKRQSRPAGLSPTLSTAGLSKSALSEEDRFFLVLLRLHYSVLVGLKLQPLLRAIVMIRQVAL
jgi:hypothetical protein